MELVRNDQRWNAVKAESILIFRDGVSESLFEMVLKEEMQNLKRLFESSNSSL